MNKVILFFCLSTFISRTYCQKMEQPTKVYAMVVGISNYKDSNVPSLKFADKDAIAFAEFLKTRIGGAVADENLVLLINEQATRVNIISKFQDLLKRVEKQDLIIFYFSGHGQVDVSDNFSYLVSSDADLTYISTTAVSMDDISKRLDGSDAKMKISYIDACHAGMFKKEGKGLAEDNLLFHRNFEKEWAKADASNISFLSAGERQKSIEKAEYGHGVFTYFLLKGLKGEADLSQEGTRGYNNGLISVRELETYLTSNIPKATNYEQRPSLRGTFEDDFPLSIIKPNFKLTDELSKIPQKKVIKPEETKNIFTPTQIPPNEKLSPGMTYTAYKCYGMCNIINQKKNPIILYAILDNWGTKTESSLIINPNSLETTPRVYIWSNVQKNNYTECLDTVGDTKFYFKTEINGQEMYATIIFPVEAGIKKPLVITDTNLKFSKEKPY